MALLSRHTCIESMLLGPCQGQSDRRTVAECRGHRLVREEVVLFIFQRSVLTSPVRVKEKREKKREVVLAVCKHECVS